MRISPYVTTLFIIFILSSISALLLYFYLDPERNLTIAYSTMGTALTLSIASFSGMFLYFFKKIYYRGLISAGTLHSSVRQGFLLAFGLLGIAIFHKLGILNYKTGSLLLFIIFLMELMIQSIVEE